MTLTLSEQETEDTINRHISELHERIKTLRKYFINLFLTFMRSL